MGDVSGGQALYQSGESISDLAFNGPGFLTTYLVSFTETFPNGSVGPGGLIQAHTPWPSIVTDMKFVGGGAGDFTITPLGGAYMGVSGTGPFNDVGGFEVNGFDHYFSVQSSPQDFATDFGSFQVTFNPSAGNTVATYTNTALQVTLMGASQPILIPVTILGVSPPAPLAVPVSPAPSPSAKPRN